MNKLPDIISQPESRRLEFKESLPTHAELAKTIIAFANDAGGELYIGIKDSPREVIGLNEDELFRSEEKISSIIHDRCQPIILPEISFLKYEDKHIIKVLVFKGSNPPYHLKNKSVLDGTYIRVGTTNRLADAEIIAELERQKLNISFDSLLSAQKSLEQLNIKSFSELFLQETGEELTLTVQKKLELHQSIMGVNQVTNALILLSDDELRKKMFPYAKIECARFKGITPGNFIDQKSIEGCICIQPELAYQFVLRHISESAADYKGVYRQDRWEYPVIAIREVIRNAVIHRDYSISGCDIKIAIFDDKIEITSPGKLPPNVDFNDMEAGQSNIRNKILAPIFKRLGIIEQWGNGLQLISNELKKYPEIELKWSEPGVAFRVSFIKKNYIPNERVNIITETSGKTSENTSGKIVEKTVKKPKTVDNTVEETSGKISEKTSGKILSLVSSNKYITIPELATIIGVSERSIERNIENLKKDKLLKREGTDRGGYWKVIKKNNN